MHKPELVDRIVYDIHVYDENRSNREIGHAVVSVIRIGCRLAFQFGYSKNTEQVQEKFAAKFAHSKPTLDRSYSLSYFDLEGDNFAILQQQDVAPRTLRPLTEHPMFKKTA